MPRLCPTEADIIHSALSPDCVPPEAEGSEAAAAAGACLPVVGPVTGPPGQSSASSTGFGAEEAAPAWGRSDWRPGGRFLGRQKQ